MLKKAFLELSILRLGILLTVFLTPLIFSRNLILSFVIPQTLFFRTLIIILLALFLVSCARRKLLPSFANFFKSPAIIFLFLFTFVTILASVLGKAPLISFFGSYVRQQGLLTHFHYVVFFLLVLFVFGMLVKKERERFFNHLLIATSLSGTLVALYGILQKFGFELFFKEFETGFLFGRIFSTLGQPDLLGSFLLFPITASFALIFSSNTSTEKLRGFGITALFLQVIALVLTLSRAAFFGFAVFIFLFLIISLFITKRKEWAWLIITIAAFSFASLVLLQGFKGTPTASHPLLSRFVLEGESLRSVESRLHLWRGSMRVFIDSPFLGHGLETFEMTFPLYQSEKLLELEEYFGTADRAHNFLLDLLATSGLFGAITFLFFLAAVLLRSFKNRINLILAAGTIGFLVSNLLGFELPVHSVFLYLFLALLLFKNSEKKLAADLFKPLKRFSLWPFSLILLAVFCVSTIYFWNLKPLLAERAYTQTQFEKAAILHPFEPAYQLGYAEQLLPSKDAEYIEKGINLIQQTITISPLNREAWIMLGRLYAQKAHFAPTGDFLALSDEAFLQAIFISPRSPVTLKPWADELFAQKRYDYAKKVYEYLLEISPKYWQWPRDSLGARPFYEQERYRIFLKDNPEFLDILKNLATIYVEMGDVGKAADLKTRLRDIQKKR